MNRLPLGRDAVATPTTVTCSGWPGWVARIVGRHPQYVLAREFQESATVRTEVPGGMSYHHTFTLSGPGLYEYRELGTASDVSGFFRIRRGFASLKLEPVSREDAYRSMGVPDLPPDAAPPA